MVYPVDSKMKIVQFWHMRAIGGPVRELTRDVKAVKWLPLKEAIDTLSRPHEKIFLANVGPVAVKAAKQALRDKTAKPADPQAREAAWFAGRTPCRPSGSASKRSARARQRYAGRSNTLVKAIGSWIERIMAQPATRRISSSRVHPTA